MAICLSVCPRWTQYIHSTMYALLSTDVQTKQKKYFHFPAEAFYKIDDKTDKIRCLVRHFTMPSAIYRQTQLTR